MSSNDTGAPLPPGLERLCLTVHLPPQIIAALAPLPGDKGRVFRLTKSGRLYHLLADAERSAGLALAPRSISCDTYARRSGACTLALIRRRW